MEAFPIRPQYVVINCKGAECAKKWEVGRHRIAPLWTGNTRFTFLHPQQQPMVNRYARVAQPCTLLGSQPAQPWSTAEYSNTPPQSTLRGARSKVKQPRAHPALNTAPHIESAFPTHTPTASISWGLAPLLSKLLLPYIKLKGCVLHYLDQKWILWRAEIWKFAQETETAAASA